MKTVALLFLACVLGAFAEEKAKAFPVRTWTSVNGNTLEGAFLKEEGGKVFILKPDGKTVATTRAKLSPNDLTWIDTVANGKPPVPAKTFEKPTSLELSKMEQYLKIRRIPLKLFAKLKNNDRSDKSLAFLQRDSASRYGWTSVQSDCYMTADGKIGQLKSLSFIPLSAMPLREGAQMAQDKFELAIPYPLTVKKVTENGEAFWELQGVPAYISRVLLKQSDEASKTDGPLVDRFDVYFPEPQK
jgi:hypothetical protein